MEKQTQCGKEQVGFRQKKAKNKRGTTAGQGIEVYSSVASKSLRLVLKKKKKQTKQNLKIYEFSHFQHNEI